MLSDYGGTGVLARAGLPEALRTRHLIAGKNRRQRMDVGF
ncbi:hypothetical protein Z945_1935 [Sulfitobacter noctilucae]|nr:hypothetical protein Z945_1935 [Sulfitobacter noctilucae]